MTNQQTAEEMLKSLLTKTDNLNLKRTKTETNTNTIKTKIEDIKRNLQDFKELYKHEFKELKKAVQNIETSQKLLNQQYKEEFKELKKTAQDTETSQDLLSRKYEDHKDKMPQLIKDHKYLYEENVDLKNEISNLKEKSCDSKKRTSQLCQYLRSSWMLKNSGIPLTETEGSRFLITKLVDLANITRFSINQINMTHKTSRKSTTPVIVLFTRKTDRLIFYKQRHKVNGLTNQQFSKQDEAEEEKDQ